MSGPIETLAFLHAHGLMVEPKDLAEALRSAVEALPRAYVVPGREGLTADEAEVARSGGLDPTPRPRNLSAGSADALAEGVVRHAKLIDTGFTTRDAAAHLGVSDARIRQRIDEGTLFALRHGRSWRLPAFQFVPGGELPGWADVCRALPPDVSPVALARWLTLPHPDLVVGDDELPTAPLDWLIDGRPPGRVATLADELA